MFRVSIGNNITRDMVRDLNSRLYPGVGLKYVTDGSCVEEINSDLDKIIEKLNQIDSRFQFIEDSMGTAIDRIETDSKLNVRAISDLRSELKRLKR